jgi:pilus assembly protein CpaB
VVSTATIATAIKPAIRPYSIAVGDTPTSRVAFRTAEEQATDTPSDVNLKGDTITLQLTDAEAEVLFTALASGQVSLALRAIDDHGPSRIVSLVGFEGSAPAPQPLLPEPPKEPLIDLSDKKTALPPTHLVRVISGDTTSFVEIPGSVVRDTLVTQ